MDKESRDSGGMVVRGVEPEGTLIAKAVAAERICWNAKSCALYHLPAGWSPTTVEIVTYACSIY